MPRTRATRCSTIFLLAVVFLCFCAGSASATPIVRAALTWDQDVVDIDLHVYDADGHHASYLDPTAVPDAQIDYDNIQGFPTDPRAEQFVDSSATPGRSFAYRACYFSASFEATPATTVTLVVTDPDGTSRSVSATLEHVDECVDLAMSPHSAQIEPVAEAEVGSGSIMTDPFTGEVDVWMPAAAPSDLTVSRTVTCPTAADVPTGVEFALVLANTDVATVPGNDLGRRRFSATFAANTLVDKAQIIVRATCAGVPISLPVGDLALIDPSGTVTNAATGLPLPGATVVLHRMPGWTPRASAAETGATTCESPESRGAATTWSQPAPATGGVPAEALDPANVISPAANPQQTNSNGRYAWDVIGGRCWYVVVSKQGFHPRTSAIVGVNVAGEPVLDLHVALDPLPAPPATAGEAPAGDPALRSDPATSARGVRTSLTMTLRKVRGGTRVSGRISPGGACASRARLVVESRSGSGWSTVASVRAKVDGAYSYVTVRKARQFRVRYLGTATAQGGGCEAATSPARRRPGLVV